MSLPAFEMPETFETITLSPEAMGVTIDGRELQGPALVVFSGTEIGHLKFHLDTKETLLPEVPQPQVTRCYCGLMPAPRSGR